MNRFRFHLLSVFSLCAAVALQARESAQLSAEKSPEKPGKERKLPALDQFEKEVEQIEARDKKSPPPKQGVLFAGSSSVRLWKLGECFPDLPVVNRGIGGSIIRQNTHYAARLILPHEPKVIVFYAGDNDLAAGLTPEEITQDFTAFVAKVREQLPKTPIIFISIKPSMSRWKLLDQQRVANANIAALCKKDKLLRFADIVPTTLGEDGKPQAGYFEKDQLHLNAAGYAAWTKVLRPILDELLKP